MRQGADSSSRLAGGRFVPDFDRLSGFASSSSQTRTTLRLTNAIRNSSSRSLWSRSRLVFPDSPLRRFSSTMLIDEREQMPGVPFRLIAAFEKDHCRKPRLGMWDFLRAEVGADEIGERSRSSCVRPFRWLTRCLVEDLERSYYVGDAAGRRGDHSDVDRKWAENAGLTFYTPEVSLPRTSPWELSRLAISCADILLREERDFATAVWVEAFPARFRSDVSRFDDNESGLKRSFMLQGPSTPHRALLLSRAQFLRPRSSSCARSREAASRTCTSPTSSSTDTRGSTRISSRRECGSRRV